MIVDTHVHIWQLPPVAPVGPTARPTSAPAEPATAEELLADMDAHGVDMTVIVQSSFSTWDNGYIADSAREHPDRLVAHGLVDPTDPQNASRVRYWTEERGLAGFRLHPVYYDEPVMSAERNAPMWEAVAELGAVIQVQMRAGHAPQVAFVAERYPAVPLVLDHMAYPDMSEYPGFASWAPVLDLARFPSVRVKVSDLARGSKVAYPHRDVQAAVRRLYDAFGIDRMMWGTGYPGRHRTAKGWPTLAEELRFIREGIDWLTAAEKERLFGGTAAAVWGL